MVGFAKRNPGQEAGEGLGNFHEIVPLRHTEGNGEVVCHTSLHTLRNAPAIRGREIQDTVGRGVSAKWRSPQMVVLAVCLVGIVGDHDSRSITCVSTYTIGTSTLSPMHREAKKTSPTDIANVLAELNLPKTRAPTGLQEELIHSGIVTQQGFAARQQLRQVEGVDVVIKVPGRVPPANRRTNPRDDSP